MLKVTKKLKEIKMDWFYILVLDLMEGMIDKRAIFKNVINTIRDVDINDEDNFKEKYKTLQSELKSFFVKLPKYRR